MKRIILKKIKLLSFKTP